MSANTMVEEKLYTVNEVAVILRVNPKTVRKMIADGELGAFRVRDEYRIRESVLVAFMQRPDRDR